MTQEVSVGRDSTRVRTCGSQPREDYAGGEPIEVTRGPLRQCLRGVASTYHGEERQPRPRHHAED